MTNEEAKEAFLRKSAVIHRDAYRHIDQRYEHISAIIYRRIDGRLCVSAELLDRCRNSVTIAKVSDLELA